VGVNNTLKLLDLSGFIFQDNRNFGLGGGSNGTFDIQRNSKDLYVAE
jgi:hypothetical protein